MIINLINRFSKATVQYQVRKVVDHTDLGYFTVIYRGNTYRHYLYPQYTYEIIQLEELNE